jgi:hypothetical protein
VIPTATGVSGLGLEKSLTAGFAAEIKGLAVALGAESGGFVHVHSANRVSGHGCFYLGCDKCFKRGKEKAAFPVGKTAFK